MFTLPKLLILLLPWFWVVDAVAHDSAEAVADDEHVMNNVLREDERRLAAGEVVEEQWQLRYDRVLTKVRQPGSEVKCEETDGPLIHKDGEPCPVFAEGDYSCFVGTQTCPNGVIHPEHRCRCEAVLGKKNRAIKGKAQWDCASWDVCEYSTFPPTPAPTAAKKATPKKSAPKKSAPKAPAPKATPETTEPAPAPKKPAPKKASPKKPAPKTDESVTEPVTLAPKKPAPKKPVPKPAPKKPAPAPAEDGQRRNLRRA